MRKHARWRAIFRSAAWCNPEPERFWPGTTIEVIASVFAMWPLTLDGLAHTVRYTSPSSASDMRRLVAEGGAQAEDAGRRLPVALALHRAIAASRVQADARAQAPARQHGMRDLAQGAGDGRVPRARP